MTQRNKPGRKIEELDDDLILCRTLGHSWDPVKRSTRLSRRKEGMTFVWDLKCLRCTSTKTEEVWASDGMVQTRTYHYVDGYQVSSHGKRPVYRSDARYELIKRLGRR